MSVNKNFSVKNGLEVATNLIVANSTTKKVGVGSTAPRAELDVRGKFIATDSYISGISTVESTFYVKSNGNAVFTALGVGGSVGIGTALPAYLLDIRSPVSTGNTALYVYGDLGVSGSLTITRTVISDLNVTGVGTIANIRGTNLNITGVTTTSNLNVTGIGTIGTLPNIRGTNLNYSGIGTIANINGTNLNVTGIGTIGTLPNINGTNLNYSGIGTIANINGTNLNYSGIGSISTFNVSTQISIPDNGYLYFGNSNDMLLYHDGSNSYLRDNGTGDLIIDGSQKIYLRSVAGENLAVFNTDSNVELYYDNSKKFETTSSGVTVTGIASVGTVNILSGIITASSGVVTYYGDGSKLSNLPGATPGGSNTQIQYNSSGSFGASSNFTFNGIDVKVVGVCTAQDFNALSDINFKKNIAPISNALKTISNLEGVGFNWKESGNPSFGIIAQQIEKYLPELVHGENPKTVNYNGIIGVLIEAIKELKSEVEDLKKNII